MQIKKTHYNLVLLSLGILFLYGNSTAVTITDTLDAVSDNTLYEDTTGSFSNGIGQYFFTGKTAIGLIRRGLILFRPEYRIPADAVITSVKLRLHMSRTLPLSGPRSIALHKVLKLWGEGVSDPIGEEGSGAQSEPGDATWIHTFYNTAFWTNAGGDYDPLLSAATNVDQTGYYEWSSPQLINDINYWINNSFFNDGWILIGDEVDQGTSKRFDTKDIETDSLRPKLIVTYSSNSIGLALTAMTEGLWHGTDGEFVVSDTLRVYLRNSLSPYNRVDSIKKYHGFLSTFAYNQTGNNYYLHLRHRNSIETWSKFPVSFTTGYATPYFFTSGASQAFGDNQTLEAGFYCIYSGDVNQDGIVDGSDAGIIDNEAFNFKSGYVDGDLNGDEIVDGSDGAIDDNNAFNFVSKVTP